MWGDAQDLETGKKVLRLLNPFLRANFAPEALENAENLLNEMEEQEAIDVVLSGFDYDGEVVPTINATAIFDQNFKDIPNKTIDQWAAENDEDLAFAVNFYWR